MITLNFEIENILKVQLATAVDALVPLAAGYWRIKTNSNLCPIFHENIFNIK